MRRLIASCIFWWVFTLACVFALFFIYGMNGPEMTFLLACLLPLWRVNFKMPDIVERHDGTSGHRSRPIR